MVLAPLDFPTTPTIGQVYPTPPVTGQPTYQWDGADWLAVNIGTLAVQSRGWIAGLTLATAGASAAFTVSPGEATDSANAVKLILASTLTKTTAAWAVGNGNGSFDGTGTSPTAQAAWYHVYLIRRPDTNVIDILTSASATAPTLPANYTQFRRIGSMKTSGSFQWIAFSQLGDEFLWLTPFADIGVTNLGTTATLYTLSVPTGVQVRALFRAYAIGSTGPAFHLITSPDETVQATPTPGGNVNIINSAAGVAGTGGSPPIRTSTAAQLRAVSSAANSTFNLTTIGWLDTRGRDV